MKRLQDQHSPIVSLLAGILQNCAVSDKLFLQFLLLQELQTWDLSSQINNSRTTLREKE